nr:ADP-ribosylglycohydrolase family protein [Belliella filtrata]
MHIRRAIGDALGAPIEFLNYESIISKYGASGVQDYVEHPDGKGEFTDDTQMLLFTAEGLLRARHRAELKGIGGAQTQITHQSYLRWLHTQGVDVTESTKAYGFMEGWLVQRKELYKRRDPGATCIHALKSNKMGSLEVSNNDSKGCGTVMRVAPVGLIFNHNRKIAFEEGVKISAITHGHPSGYLSGGLLASIIADLSQGLDLKASISNGLRILKKWNGHEEVYDKVSKARSLHKQYKNKNIDQVAISTIGEGWVAEEALAIALLCALHYPNNFKSAVLTSINHGGDSDSTGAITGNIVGLMVGQEQIPHDWQDKLMHKDIVEEIGIDLNVGCKSNYSYDD